MGDESTALVSALMDGEADDRERTWATDALLADPQLLAAWQRYHVVRDVIRHRTSGFPAAMGAAAAARLSAAIATEETYTAAAPVAPVAPSAANVVPLRRPRTARGALIGLAAAGGIGVAAWFGLGDGVRAVSTGGLKPVVAASVGDGPGMPSVDAASFAPDGAVLPAAYRATAMSAEDAQRARWYMFLHAHRSGMNHASQAMPFAKVVSFETL